jgi:hypothetical protein
MLNQRIAVGRRIAADLHSAENAIDVAIVKIAQLSATLPTSRLETRMSAIVGQEAIANVTAALAAAGHVRQMLTDAHSALSETQKQVGLGTQMFGDGMNKPRLAPVQRTEDIDQNATLFKKSA